MSLASGDLQFYASLSQPLDDVMPAGGAIDLTTKILTSILFGLSKVTVVSSSASDVSRLRIIGRGFNGTELIEDINLNGTAPVIGKTYFDIVNDIHLSSSAVGDVVIKDDDDVTFATISTGLKGYTSLFKFSHYKESDDITRYEKMFIRNIDGSAGLQSGKITITSDTSTYLSVGTDSGLDNSLSISNRITAPAGVTFSSTFRNFPATVTFGTSLGIWVKQTVPARELTSTNTVVLTVSGTSS